MSSFIKNNPRLSLFIIIPLAIIVISPVLSKNLTTLFSLGLSDESQLAQVYNPHICNPNTYYIDYESGNDSNDGKCSDSPWKKHPYMNGSTGLSKAYVHKAGDKFIFKGGSVWRNDAFPLLITKGGTASAYNYYGADFNWYSGSNWTRPVFDVGPSMKPFYVLNTSYVTIDNIEVAGHIIQQGRESMNGGISIGSSNNINIKNCYLHDWIINTSSDNMFGGIVTVSSSNILVENCHIKGPLINSVNASGAGWYDNGGSNNTVRFSEIENTAQGTFGVNYIYDNYIHHILGSFDPVQHDNGVWINPGGKFYNNVMHDITVGTTLYVVCGWGSYTGPILVYNNIIYNSTASNIKIDPSAALPTDDMQVYVYNNILQRDGSVIATTGRTGIIPINVISIKNNILIHNSWSGIPFSWAHPVNNYTEQNNYILTLAQAATLNLISSNLFNITANQSMANITDVGQTISCSNCTDINKDISGNPRPRGSAWDIGAYEYQGVTPPTTYSLSILKPGTGQGTVISGGGSINCGTNCSTTANSGTSVTLTATPNTGSTFTSWSGVTGCSTNNVCTFTLNSNTAVTATFTSSPTPINGSCGSTLNTCTQGTFSDVTDTTTNYLWSCVGSNGGTTASCSLPIPSTKFSTGQRVQVSRGPLNVRSTPSTSGTLLGTQATGVLGTVTSGPTSANNYSWWNINYDSGVDGWSVEDFLGNYTPPVPVPCTSNDWTSTDGLCQSSNTLTRTWTKINPTCSGGITHPATETITCVYVPLTSVCPTSNLKYGMRDTCYALGTCSTNGGNVYKLQTFLATETNPSTQTPYLTVPPTGFFGFSTYSAIKRFQKNNRISSTGYVGPLTLNKIKVIKGCQ